MAEVLASRYDITKEDPELNRKISLANEGFTNRYCELALRDRNRLSKESIDDIRIDHCYEKRDQS